MRTIVESIRRHALSSPDQLSVITGSTETSYAELWLQIARAANWYVEKGIRLGDRVLISADSRDPFYVAAYFGAHLAGCIAVPLGFRSSADEISYRANKVTPKLAVFGNHLAELRDVLKESGDDCSVAGERMPDLSDIAEIMFTTGSTGEPKGVTLTHENIAASARLIKQFVGNTHDDIEVVTVPLTHSFGLGRLRSTLLAGGTIVLVPGLTFPRLTLRALSDLRATGLACVPAGISLLMAKYEAQLQNVAEHLRYMEMGSAPLLVAEKKRLCSVFPNTRLCMHYGLTEASRSTFMEFHSDAANIDSVGKPSPGVEIKIIEESGREQATGDVGNIHVRAATVMKGYWNDEHRTLAVLDRDSGWLDTGDLGFIDSDGYIHLVGRVDDVINTGGVNVLPEAIENIARTFAGVHDCGCVGVEDPDGILGEVPLLFIVAESDDVDLDDLSRHIVKQFGHEVPKIIVKTTDRVPRSASGKLLRGELRLSYQSETLESR